MSWIWDQTLLRMICFWEMHSLVSHRWRATSSALDAVHMDVWDLRIRIIEEIVSAQWEIHSILSILEIDLISPILLSVPTTMEFVWCPLTMNCVVGEEVIMDSWVMVTQVIAGTIPMKWVMHCLLLIYQSPQKCHQLLLRKIQLLIQLRVQREFPP